MKIKAHKEVSRELPLYSLLNSCSFFVGFIPQRPERELSKKIGVGHLAACREVLRSTHTQTKLKPTP